MQKRLLLFLLLYSSALAGQGSLVGVVRDETGAAVAGAAIEIRNTATGVSFRNVAPDGHYEFAAAPPGSYSVTVFKTGFKTLRREGVTLRTGDRAALDLVLELGEVSDSVLVNAGLPLLSSSRGTVSFTVERRKTVTLPLDGRNFVPLIALSPGVNLPPGSSFPRINGGRPRVSEYIYDGISVLQPEPGQVAYFPVIDAIEEFRVETNSYSAEYGRANGGVILVNQRSGSNDFHGTVFEFFRNEALNARNLFAPAGPKPRFRRNQYGFAAGGPMQKDRTFFFTDWQGSRLQTGLVRISTVPEPASRLIATDAAAKRLLARYPDPNISGRANNYRRTGNERVAQDQFDVRLDRYFGERHRVFARYSSLHDASQPVTPLPDGSGAIPSGIVGSIDTKAHSLAAEYNVTFDGARANQLRFGHTGRGFNREPQATGPIYEIAGYQSLGPPSNSKAEMATRVAQVSDTFTWIAGGHSVKTGFDWRGQSLDVLQPPSPDGLYQFAGLTAFLQGQVQRYQIDVQEETLRPRANIAEFFVQDDIRASGRLSVNLGLRYTLNFPSTVEGDRGAVFNLDTQQLDFLGRDGFPRSARNLETGNFGPRVGLAYKLTESLAVRSGYGITWIEQAGITTPFTIPLFPFIRTYQQLAPNNATGVFVLEQGPSVVVAPPGRNSGLGQSVFGVQRDQKSGYAQQWNLSVQRTFAKHWSVEAGYLGSKLTNLGVPDVNLNQVSLDNVTAGRPYPQFQTVALYRNNVGHSTYHSFQSRMEKRLSTGFTFAAAYTFSRLIDDAGAVFDSAIVSAPASNFQAADSYNRRLEKDVSTGSIPHIFSSGFVWDIHRGWQVSGVVRAQSGSPMAVTQQPNLNAFAGFGIQRPNRLRDPALENRTTSRWFDTSAFILAPQLTVGNSSRNPVVGPGYRTVDLMVGRTVTLSEKLRLEIRAEVFNLTNTPPLGNPNGQFGTPAFGSINSALDPRVFELVCKLHF